jgi:nicotinate dehydrogenase subunit A
MAAKAALDQTPRPTEAQLKRALDGVLCRCGTHDRVIRAVMRAAATMGGG